MSAASERARRLRARSPRTLRVALLCAIVAVSAWVPAAAPADVFQPISLVSAIAPPAVPADRAEQADYAHDPALSGDSNYVAFDGSFGGVTGVWRRDIATGAVEPVAVGAAGSPQGSAELPSISEEGRYVSFTTSAPLVEGDHNEGPDVYVRDMDVPESETGAFTLASAVNGTQESLTYTTSEPTRYGSIAAGGSALSDGPEGLKVAFVTTAISNLAGPETPAMQVAVRNLTTKQTQLVSVVYDPASGTETGEPVPASGEFAAAVYPGVKLAPRFPIPPPLSTMGVGASISADGSTVAWLGQEIERQAPVLAHEPNMRPEYTEPLWRRIDDGPQAPIRRVTGGGDPASAACAASGETTLLEPATVADPCQGPFNTAPQFSATPGTWTLAPTGDYLPRLSANGMTVAFLSNARYVAGGGEEFGTADEFSNDLYVVNMEEGLTRVQAITRLTELSAGAAEDWARVAPIAAVAISPDGTQVAFTTQRTLFPLGSPAFVSAPPAEPGELEVFDADLADQTLTRVTQSFKGGPSEQSHVEIEPGEDPYNGEQGAFSPSFSTDGNELAFASTAANLVYDDGNAPPAVTEVQKNGRDGSNVYVVRRKTFGGEAPAQYVSAPPANQALEPSWILSASARSLSNGSVQLYIVAPGPGRLGIGAKSSVRIAAASKSTKGKPARRSSASGARVVTTVAARTVATAAAQARDTVGELITSTLTLAPLYRSLAAARGGLSATVTVTFTAPGRPVLRDTIPVTFLREVKGSTAHSSKARRSSKAHGRSSKATRR
ncbi:MAG: hypothetical protein ACLQBY_18790 [Solirubrobacteraceae bacterium]